MAEELLDTMAQDVTEDEYDELAVELDDQFKQLESIDEVAGELEDVKYQAPAEKETDIEGRLEKLNEESEAASEAADELPAALANRLKKLEDSDETASEEESGDEKETSSEEE